MPSQVTSFFTGLNRRHFLMLAGAVFAVGIGARFIPATAQSTAPENYDILDAQTAFEAAQKGDIILVDIRRPDEWATKGIGEGAVALDMRAENL